jgi:hypothetical protein
LYIILLIFLINAAGFLLKYNNLDRFIIIFGFRFHLSLVLPFLFLIFKKKFTFIRQEIKKFNGENFIINIILVLIPLLIMVTVLFVLRYIKSGNPDYLYEFGISSIVDLPVYFIWNLPQLLMIALFLKFIISAGKLNFLSGPALIFLLFIYELIPLQKEKFMLFVLFDLISASILFSIIALNVKNIYSFAVSVYLFLWSNIFLFGSENKSLINNIFAKNYAEWDGLLELSKQVIHYNFLIQTLFTIILFLIYYIVSQRKQKSY